MRIAVQDANVLIDLELAGLFDLWFQLGVETHTTDLIRSELEEGGHVQALACFKSGQVREHGLSFEELPAEECQVRLKKMETMLTRVYSWRMNEA